MFDEFIFKYLADWLVGLDQLIIFATLTEPLTGLAANLEDLFRKAN